MWRWFTYDSDEGEEAGTDYSKQHRQHQGPISNPSSPAPTSTFDKLDPMVTAATLAQAAFRGYRLRERLRRLPAREAEKQIRALHRNARGFRRVGLFLTFSGLYFALVFYGVDVSFQRSVQQALTDHLALVKYGPNSDKTAQDVSSLQDVHQWIQAFYRETYDGTQAEHPCTPCAIMPPDEVCDACDFDLYNARTAARSLDGAGGSEGGPAPRSRRRRRRLVRSSGGEGAVVGGWGSSSSSSSSSSSISSSGSTLGVSRQCGACLVGRSCNLEVCEAALRTSSSSSSSSSSSPPSSPSSLVPSLPSSAAAGADSAATDPPLSPSPSTSPPSSSASPAFNISALIADLDLEPAGGVRASGGYLTVEKASECYSFDTDVGSTENIGRFLFGLEVPYNGNGFVANRNRVVGGMLVTFTLKPRLPEDRCGSSRDYYDVCLADGVQKTPISLPEVWQEFRPNPDLEYSEAASGYPLLIDAGGFNTGLNFGYCTLLLLEDLDVISADEVGSVTVQLVTYNGNLPSAYGTIHINFDFNNGGEVVTEELVTAYMMKSNVGGGSDRARFVLSLIFFLMALAMMRHDTKKWCRARRSKAKRNRCHCCCGCLFFTLVVVNLLMWLFWVAYGLTTSFDTDVQQENNDDSVLDSVTDQILTLQEAALFSAAYYIVFLLTTMAGLYRWIFQMLSFHKRMSIVTDTLSGASTHLDHFLLVFFMVILVFAALTWLLVGSSFREFSTLTAAWRSVTRLSLGEAENFYPQILAAQPTVGPVVVVLYQVLGIVLLLNVVIAILLEAYRGVVGGMVGEDTIFQSFVAFVGMSFCSLRTRIRWADAWARWRLGRLSISNTHRGRQQRRPSLKVFLQGSTGVYGVNGRPVMMVRRPPGGPDMEDRQLSFNCPRYISVAEMQALIEAAPVPARVADRLVRRIVHNWVFHSSEKPTGDFSRASSSGRLFADSSSAVSANAVAGSGSSSRSLPPSDPSLPLLRRGPSSSIGHR